MEMLDKLKKRGNCNGCGTEYRLENEGHTGMTKMYPIPELTGMGRLSLCMEVDNIKESGRNIICKRSVAVNEQISTQNICATFVLKKALLQNAYKISSQNT
jgi:hypothetical protein